MKLKALIAILIPLLFVGCDSLFDKGDVEKEYDGPAQVEFKPLQQEVSEIDQAAAVRIQLIGEQPSSDVTVNVEVDGASTAQAGVHFNLTSTQATITANSSTVDLPVQIIDSGVFGASGEVALVLNITSASNDVQVAENLSQATVFISEFERAVALGTQAVDNRTTPDTLQALATGVTAIPGDAIVVTTNPGVASPTPSDFVGERIVGYTLVEQAVSGGSVYVDLWNFAGGSAGNDYVAHVIRSSQASQSSLSTGVVSNESVTSSNIYSSGVAPVYSVDQFAWSDVTVTDSTNTVSIDVVEIGYEGSVGQDTVSIDLHEAAEDSTIGAFVGVSAQDLEVNTAYNNVQVDVVEPVAPGDSEATREEDFITGTGLYFAMAHLGPAGLDANGDRIPAQQPALSGVTTVDDELTFSPVGEYATVTVDTTVVPVP